MWNQLPRNSNREHGQDGRPAHVIVLESQERDGVARQDIRRHHRGADRITSSRCDRRRPDGGVMTDKQQVNQGGLTESGGTRVLQLRFGTR